MQVRHRSWLLAALVVAVPLGVRALAASSGPATVAIESVGIARHTGCAVLHIATSEPMPVRIDRQPGGRLIVEFAGAVMGPQATRALDQTPVLRDVVSLRQSASTPPTVRMEAVSTGADPPVAERFADGCGLIVRLSVGAQAPPPVPPAVGSVGPAPATEREVRVAGVSGVRTAPIALTPASSPVRGVDPVQSVLRTVAALTGLGRPSVLGSPEPRAADAPVRLVSALIGLPTETLAARPKPRDDAAADERPLVRRIRVVEMEPLKVAIDCAPAAPYQIDRLASGSAYVLLLSGARLDAKCERSIALHPVQEAWVSAQETPEGALITIPAADGQECVVRVGASPNTLVCELAPGTSLVAQAPEAGATVPAPAPAGEPTVNLDFQEAPVVEILTALAKYANRNIVTTTAVSGTMSVHLADVTLTQALDVITKLNELDYALLGEKNYIVGTAEEVARFKPAEPAKLTLTVTYKPTATTPERIVREMQEVTEKAGVTTKIVEDTKSVVFMDVPDQETAERLKQLASELDVPPADTTRWVQLEHLTPAEAAATLKDLITNVEIRMPGPEAPQIGVIGLVGKTTDVDEAEGLLTTIDVERPTPVEPPPGELANRTLLVTYVDPKQVVEAITSVYGEKVQAVVITSEQQLQDAQDTEMAGGLRPGGRIMVRGPESLLPDVERLVADLDAAPPQVEITTTITDVRVDREKTHGLQWEFPGLNISERATAGDGFRFGKFVRAPLNATGAGSFSASFDALQKDTDTTILSRTTLIAMQGKTANFLVGDIIPYETSVAADGTVTRSVEREEIGLGLKFAPTVDSQGGITLYVAPKVRSFTGYSPAGYPIIATREAQSILRCRDGDVIAIGGLLRDEQIQSLSGVPFLKDLPFFGELFKKRQTQKRKSEVIVFAEVKLLRPDRQPVESAEGEAMGQ
ncbi:MAG: type II secretion system protein GspD [Armatimonadetes bacterium]|nr:type II secretion system protein GspD [Armatimonadota bacterium]